MGERKEDGQKEDTNNKHNNDTNMCYSSNSTTRKHNDYQKRAKEMTNTIRDSRESGDGRSIAILKTGFTERTIYEYYKEFPFLKEEMSKFKKDKRLYK